MKIVIATPILYNPLNPFNHLFKDIIGGFLSDGNKIIRLVAVEDKKETKFKYGYTNSNIEYKLFKRKNSNHKNIISRHLRDTFTNIRQAFTILFLKNVDVLFEDVSYSSYWVVNAAKIKGIKVVAMLQDVWPDNAVQSHLISEKSFIYKYFEFWQKKVYKKADKIICISDDMKKFIISKNVNPEKIEVIYNWGYTDDIIDIPWHKNEFVRKYKLTKDKFYAIYAGNIGKMQNVDVIINAAEQLKNDKKIKFIIVGDGVKKNEIEEKIKSKNLKNVQILPFQPSNIAPHIYSSASVNMITLVKGATKTALPSKTGIILSCGKPIIACVDKESNYANIISKRANGIVIDSEDYLLLAKKIKYLAYNNYKVNSYKCYIELFNRKKNLKKYMEVIKK